MNFKVASSISTGNFYSGLTSLTTSEKFRKSEWNATSLPSELMQII